MKCPLPWSCGVSKRSRNRSKKVSCAQEWPIPPAISRSGLLLQAICQKFRSQDQATILAHREGKKMEYNPWMWWGFVMLKHALNSKSLPPILTMIFILDADASTDGLGAVPSQKSGRWSLMPAEPKQNISTSLPEKSYWLWSGVYVSFTTMPLWTSFPGQNRSQSTEMAA